MAVCCDVLLCAVLWPVVNVIVTDKVTQRQKAVGSLGEGMYFGEIALLEDNSIRTATIQAAAFCDLFVLTRDDLHTVFKR